MSDLKDLLAQKKLARERAKRAHSSTESLSVTENILSEGSLNKRLQGLALLDKLRPYQAEDVLITLSNYRSGRPTLNASQMGLGKTREAASFLATIKTRYNLWLTSKNLIGSTARQLNDLGIPCIPVKDPNVLPHLLPLLDNNPPGTMGPVLIMNYEALRGKISGPILLNRIWNVVVIDEVSKLKGGANPNGSTLIWRLAKDLLHPDLRTQKDYPEPAQRELPKPYALFLSGTPVENRPAEIWAYLHLFEPETFKSLSAFERIFTSTGFRLDTEKLYEILSRFVIRRTPKSIGFQLPPMSVDYIFTDPIDPTTEVGKVYKSLVDQARASIEGQPSVLSVSMLLEELLRLRQILQTGPTFTFTKTLPESDQKITQTIKFNGPFPKLDAAEEKIFDLINEGEQVVVFSCFNQPLYELQQRFSMFNIKTQVVDGTTSKNMNEFEEDFQQGKIQILFINKRTGSQGLNLQKCDQWLGGSSYAIHLDQWWNPAVEDQANARLLRMNTTEPVFVYYFLVERSVDELIKEIVDLKAQAADELNESVTLTKEWVLDRLQ